MKIVYFFTQNESKSIYFTNLLFCIVFKDQLFDFKQKKKSMWAIQQMNVLGSSMLAYI